MNTLVSALHDATHRVPGVPEHRDGRTSLQPHAARATRQLRGRSPRPHHHGPHRQSNPRVLVGWQTWIAGLLGRRNAEWSGPGAGAGHAGPAAAVAASSQSR